MNQLAIIRKHLKGIDMAFDGVKTTETKKRAGGMIREAFHRYEGFCLPALEVGGTVTVDPVPAVTLVADVYPGTLGGEVGGLGVGVAAEVGRPVEAVETASVWVCAVEEVTGTFAPSTLVGPEGVDVLPDKMIGGWPELAEVEIIGLAPNRRSLKGWLVADRRTVSVERGLRSWKAGDVVKTRLVRAGQFPLFRIMV